MTNGTERAPSKTRWEYLVDWALVHPKTPRDRTRRLNALGLDGWELVAADVQNDLFYLKRPLTNR